MATLTNEFLYGSLFRMTDAAVKAALLLGLAAIVVMLLRRSSASIRHLVWALGLGSALLLPLLSWNMPHWRVPYTVPPTHLRPLASAPTPSPAETSSAPTPASASVPAQSAPLNPTARTRTEQTQVQTTVPAALPPVAPAARFPRTTWVLLIWMSGVILVLARLARGLLLVRQIARTSMPITDGPLADAARTAVVPLGIARPVSLRLAEPSGPVTVPLTYGTWRPAIVIPSGAPEWPEGRVKAALLHEMAHVRRHDWPIQVMARVVCAVYWFNPLVWLAARRLRAEAEAACDDLVLGAGMSAKDYARHLLDVALCARRSRRAGWGAVAMAQSPQVEGRLRAVLAQHSRRPVTRRAAAVLVAAALLLALPLAALRLVAQAQAVPAAARLQLQGDFTLRYAVTITDQMTTEAQFRQYQKLRADYRKNLKADRYLQPVPAEYYAPFSYFQSRRPRSRHAILTVSVSNGRLLWRKEEEGHTFALVYNGTDGTQLFSDGHSGRVEPGLEFSGMSDCPLPAVGLPHVPLFKGATLAESSGASQTWRTLSPLDSAETEQGKVAYTFAEAHMVSDGGTWKALDVDSGGQRFQFLQHRRFQGLWIASHMLLTKYEEPILSSTPPFTSEREFLDYVAAHRTATSVCEYRLLSAGGTPLDMSAAGMRVVSAAAPRSRDVLAPESLDSFEVQEALHLRYHLQGWAMTQKTALRQLAQGRPGARAAATLIDASLHGLPSPLWTGDPRPNHVWDGDPRVGHDGQKPLFTAEHSGPTNGGGAGDFEIARSPDIGPAHVVLWASGRITRGGQEIVPAFYGADGATNMAGDGTDVPAHEAAQATPDDAEAQSRLAEALYAAYDAQTHRSKSKPWTFGPPAVLVAAIQHMQAAVAQRPDEWQLQESFGWFLARRHRWAEAVPHLRRAREMLDASGFFRVIRRAAANGNNSQGPVYSSLYALCDAFVRDGDDKDAALHYMQALVAAQGDAYADAGRYREAGEQYQKALQFDSFTSYVVFAQGDALRRAGHRAEAHATWKRILSIDPPKTCYYEQVRARL